MWILLDYDQPGLSPPATRGSRRWLPQHAWLDGTTLVVERGNAARRCDLATVCDVTLRAARLDGFLVLRAHAGGDKNPSVQLAIQYRRRQHLLISPAGLRLLAEPLLGTANTPDYVAAYTERWLPRLRARYQPPSGPPQTEEEHRLDAMFHPERRLRPELAPHPAHVHINQLAGYRRAGHGRELMSTFLASVAAAGAASCRLGVDVANVDATRFYARVGWRPIEIPGVAPGTYLVHPAG
jgi:ribosomal protein S18 acetylase RimI-like enzyme